MSETDIAVWDPDPETVADSNLVSAMGDCGLIDYETFHRWTIEDRAGFWNYVIRRLGILFVEPPVQILGSSEDVESPEWLAGSRLNIVESCFSAKPESTAVVYSTDKGLHRLTYGDLRTRVLRAAASYRAFGIESGDRIAISMPMTVESVIAYLATIWIGAVVVSIADSFTPDEIRMRLEIAQCYVIVTQDEVHRDGKDLPMYSKVIQAGAERAIVVDTGAGLNLRSEDIRWDDFLITGGDDSPAYGPPEKMTNILFSSGTTGTPKAIAWNQLSPIKAAMDGHFHQDIHPRDVVAWPTNIGWMMGPWLIYAPLISGASLALYHDTPNACGFGRFIEQAGVTILGVIPSLVATWRASGVMENYDWSAIRLFSSTGEASNPTDMSYLMNLAGGKPVIEYCGGTELSGSYITGTVLHRSIPSQFSTSTLGMDLLVLDDEYRPTRSGEVFLVPPSIGLSEALLNGDHHDVYYEGVATIDGVKLRRHGDHMEELGNGYYRAHGRVDDTMNIGGIKVSSAEIERVVETVPGVAQTAAVAVEPSGGGPSRVVIFVVESPGFAFDIAEGRVEIQAAINVMLNPLFKIHDVVLLDDLPRTATNKVMRRVLRDRYTLFST